MDDNVNPPLEGKIYGEISGWVTMIEILTALLGVIVSIISGVSVFNYDLTVKDLLRGCNESTIWIKDTTFHSKPSSYWFISIEGGDAVAMLGIAITIYGGILGMLGVLLSMFRDRDVLLYKRGLYAILSLLISLILIYCAFLSNTTI